MKSFNKTIALLLAIVMVISASPVISFSKEAKQKTSLSESTAKNTDVKKLRVIDEVEEKRDEFTKVYALEDGSMYEVKTCVPMHIEKRHKWVEAENISEPETVSDISATITELTDSIAESENTLDDIDTSTNSAYSYLYVSDESDVPNSIGGDSAVLIKDPSTMSVNSAELTYSYIVKMDFAPIEDAQSSEVIPQQISGYVCDEEWTSESSSTNPEFTDIDYRANTNAESIGSHRVDVTNTYVYDASFIYNRWENGSQENHGLCFIGSSDSEGYVSLSSVTFERRYKNMVALNTETTYHTVDMGFAGTAYIDDYKNHIDVARDEIGLPANALPVSVKRLIFHDSLGEAYYYGDSSYINYHSVITKQGSIYTWRSLDFVNVSFTVTNTAQSTADNEGLGYTLNVSTKTITSADGYTYKFASYSGNYYLTSIKDDAATQNEIKIEYKTSNYRRRINYIEEKSSGRRYVFEYTNVAFAYNQSSLSRDVLTSITVKEKSGTSWVPVKVGNEDVKVTYTYTAISSTEICMNKATYPTGEYAFYLFNSNGKLKEAYDNLNDTRVVFDYSGSVPKYTLTNNSIAKVTTNRPTQNLVGFTEQVKNAESSSPEYLDKSGVNIQNHYAFKRVFDEGRTHIESNFDNEFRPSLVIDSKGDSYLFDYGSIENSLTKIKEHRSMSSYLYNGDFGNESDGWELISEDDNQTIEGIDLTLPDNSQEDVLELGATGLESAVAYQVIAAEDVPNHSTLILDADAYLNAGASITDNISSVELYVSDSDGELEEGAAPLISLTFGDGIPYEKQHKCGYWEYDDESIENFVIRITYSPHSTRAFFDNITLIADQNESLIQTITVPVGDSLAFPTETEITPTESFEVDAHGLPLSHILTYNGEYMLERFTYDSALPYSTTSRTDFNNATTSYSYNGSNGLLLSKTRNGATTSFTYNPLGLLASVSTVYNDITTNNPVTLSNTYTYENNRIASVAHDSVVYTFTYDSFGKVKSVNYSTDSGTTSSALISSSYVDGNVDTITYANGDQIKYTYDSNTKNITKIAFKESSANDFVDVATYQYNVGSEEKIRINDLGSDRKISIFKDGSYSVRDLNTGSCLPELQILRMQNKSDGTVEGNIFDFTYNFRREDSELDENQGITKTSSVISIGIEEQRTSFTFTDGENQIPINYEGVHTNNIKTFTAEASKDAFGRVLNTNIRYDNDEQEERTLDAEYSYKSLSETSILNNTVEPTSNLITQYSISTTSEDDPFFDYTFYYDYDDTSDLVKSISYVNAVDSNNDPVLHAYYKYDSMDRLIMEYNKFKDSVTEYKYNENGNISEVNVIPFDSIRFPDSEPDTEPDATFSYIMADEYGYEKTIYTYSESNPNRLVSIERRRVSKNNAMDSEYVTSYGTQPFAYDNSGNTLNTYCEGKDYNLTWDGDRLVAAESNVRRMTYDYDVNGNLVTKTKYTISNGNASLSNVTKYVWNDGRLEGVELIDDEEIFLTISAKYIYDEQGYIVGMIPHYKYYLSGYLPENTPDPFQSTFPIPNDSVVWFIHDGQGNTISMYSEDTGISFEFTYNSSGRLDFDFSGPHYGTLTGWSGLGEALQTAMFYSMFINHEYRSYIKDIETGLTFCNGRVYNPTLNRFLNFKPETLLSNIDNYMSTNEYAYARNNPVNFDATNQTIFDKNSPSYTGIKTTVWMRGYFS